MHRYLVVLGVMTGCGGSEPPRIETVEAAVTTAEDTPVDVVFPVTEVLEGATAVIVQPAHGTIATGSAASMWRYTPAQDFAGADTFTIQITDGASHATGVAMLVVTAVNDAPVAVGDDFTVTEETALVGAVVVANDSDVEGDPLTVTLVTAPSHAGSFALGADGAVTYTPEVNFHGTDSFAYKVGDGTLESETATATITVTNVNDVAVASPDAFTTNEDTALSGANVLANDTDDDGDPLAVVVVAAPAHAASFAVAANGAVTYTPAANFSGGDSFTYKVNDGIADSNTVTVSITVTAVNDAPAGVNDAFATNEDTALAGANVLANDSDVEGSVLTAALVAGPTHAATFSLATTGAVTYVPAANFHGTDSFSYRANDGTADSAVTTVTITVNPVNDAPVAVANTFTTSEDTVLTGANVLTNDSDADLDPLTAVLVTSPTHAATFALATNGAVTYVPAANFNGSDSFTYRANDGTVNSNVVTVTINITAVNDAPVAVNNSFTINEDTSLAGANVLSNDTDVEGAALTAVLVSGPAHAATFALASNGAVTYTPVANFSGTDSFTYRANDGTANSNVATVTITINSVNDAPVATNATRTCPDSGTITVTLNATDADGNPLTFAIDQQPANGIVTLDDNVATYTSNGALGPDSFKFHANDGIANSNIATVSITVLAAVCGDGARNATEECDDGNDIPDDGCESDCTFSCGSDTDPIHVFVEPTTQQCWATYHHVPQDFDDAELACAALIGGHLPSIGTQQENDRLFLFLDVGETAWIGLRSVDQGGGSFAFEWVDGQPVTFTNVPGGLPAATANACVVFDLADGTWDVTTCSNATVAATLTCEVQL